MRSTAPGELVLNQARDRHKIGWTVWKLTKHILEHMEYLVDVHGHHTVAEALRYGLAQGPTLSPTLFNISMDEILRALDNGERGIDLGGIRVIGSAW